MRPRKKIHPIRCLLMAITVLCTAILLLGRYGLTVTAYDIYSEKISQSFDGFKIVQLSDLHGAEFGRENDRLIKKVGEQSPDIIVLTGDFVTQGKAEAELPRLKPLFEGLAQIAPVYFVSGNHDWASKAINELAQILADSGARYLRNEYELIERGGDSIALAGVEDPNGRSDMPRPDELVDVLRRSHSDEFTLLLGHRNYWLEQYPELPVDLVVCGHSHGGIIRLPGLGGLLSTGGGFFPEYDTGLFHGGSYDMIVSSGLGSSVSIPRFLNTPEIVTIILHAAG